MTTGGEVAAAVDAGLGSVAVVFASSGRVELACEGGEGVDEHSLFEVGSVTKTLTATLLADMVLAGELTLDTQVGEIADLGPNGAITVGELATHTSGLPRLPPNLMVKAEQTPDDPYVAYMAEDLVEGARSAQRGSSAPEYSNFGYMLLGHVLSVSGGAPLGLLLVERVFAPLHMKTATLAPGPPAVRLSGHQGERTVAHWSHPLPGAGGVEASISDMDRYLAAQLHPESTDLEIAIRMTHNPGHASGECLAWQRAGRVLWHNGGTGGFSSFIGFDRDAARGVAVLANTGGNRSVDAAGFQSIGIVNPLVG